MRRAVLAATFVTAVLAAPFARAADAQPSVDLTKDVQAQTEEPEGPPPEAPPPRPYKKSVVLDSSIGAMAFFGKFGQVAPPGPLFRTQLGYEVLKWLMLFGEGELAFTDTSGREAPPRTRAFPIFGFGGGARFTARFGERLGVYVQASVGMMKADVGHNALGNLGFRDAESLDTYAGARLGFEYYQIDRHFALGLNVGTRLAQGFDTSRVGTNDTPLIGDAGASLRYAF